MSIRTYECPDCGQKELRDVPMTSPAEFSKLIYCITCGVKQRFDRVYTPPAVAFGMYTKRYTGQVAAVEGWGSYETDYKKSDLVKGRAREAAEERIGQAIKPPERRS